MVVGIPPREASSRLVVFQVSRSCDHYGIRQYHL